MKTAAHNHLNFAASHRPTPYRGGMGRLGLPTPLSRDVSWDDLGRGLRRLGLVAPEERELRLTKLAQAGGECDARYVDNVASILVGGGRCGGSVATAVGSAMGMADPVE